MVTDFLQYLFDGLSTGAIYSLLAGRERYLALEVQGLRYNIGLKYGLLVAQLALALDGHDREEILAQMVELLAARGARNERGGVAET